MFGPNAGLYCPMKFFLPLLLFGLAEACSKDAGSENHSCVPLSTVSDQCPPTWTSAQIARATFCSKNAPFFDSFLSTSTCRGTLHYSTYLFDGGPRYCVYDAATEKLIRYGAFDPKAMFEQMSCGSAKTDFNTEGCAGVGCPRRPDASTGP